MRNIAKRWLIIILVLALALGMASALAGCGFFTSYQRVVQGSGALKQQKVPLSNRADGYTLRVTDVSFQLRGRAELKLVIDESLDRMALLETDSNIMPLLRLDCNPTTGEIRLSAPRGTYFSPTKLILTVGVPVQGIAVDGVWEISYDCPSVKACRVTTDGSTSGDFTFGALDSLDIQLEGLSDIDVRCASARTCRITGDGDVNGAFAFGDMDSLDLCINGLSKISMSGSARRAVIQLDGDSNIRAFDLTARDADVTISGLGSCEITAEQSLHAVIDGSGSITYGGSPAVSQQVDGLGSVKAR